MKHQKNQLIYPMGLCDPWGDSFIHNFKLYQKLDNKTKMTFCWKALDHSQNNYEELTQWAYVPLGKTLTYKNSNLNNLSNYLEAN